MGWSEPGIEGGAVPLTGKNAVLSEKSEVELSTRTESLGRPNQEVFHAYYMECRLDAGSHVR
jgi:hypothetical protein